MSTSFLAAAAARAADALPPGAARTIASELGFAPDDTYDYDQHLREIKGDGIFISRAATDAAAAAANDADMDDDLMAALQGDDADEGGDMTDDFMAELVK